MTPTIYDNNVNVIKEGEKIITRCRKGSKFNRQIGEIEGKSTPLVHIYTTAHFSGFFIYCNTVSGVAKLILWTNDFLRCEIMQLCLY
jgi:hypothetical protein